jgi:hypothetical protein
MFRRRRFYRRPIIIRPGPMRPLWRPFWRRRWVRPAGCGLGLLLPLCVFGMLLMGFVARHF